METMAGRLWPGARAGAAGRPPVHTVASRRATPLRLQRSRGREAQGGLAAAWLRRWRTVLFFCPQGSSLCVSPPRVLKGVCPLNEAPIGVTTYLHQRQSEVSHQPIRSKSVDTDHVPGSSAGVKDASCAGPCPHRATRDTRAHQSTATLPGAMGQGKGSAAGWARTGQPPVEGRAGARPWVQGAGAGGACREEISRSLQALLQRPVPCLRHPALLPDQVGQGWGELRLAEGSCLGRDQGPQRRPASPLAGPLPSCPSAAKASYLPSCPPWKRWPLRVRTREDKDEEPGLPGSGQGTPIPLRRVLTLF